MIRVKPTTPTGGSDGEMNQSDQFLDALPRVEGQDPYRVPPMTSEDGAYFSQFGGLWTDLDNAVEIGSKKLDDGTINETEHRNLLTWIRQGYVILPNAVPHDLIDVLNSDLESIWVNGHPKAWVSAVEHGRGVARPLAVGDKDKVDNLVKLVDVYEYLRSSRPVIFAPLIQRFLELIFERPVLAHQSLTFVRGSKQPIHQDTAFVRMSSPMELAASWIALEDVTAGSGELQYYEGSHRFEEFLFENKYKWFPPGNTELGDFYKHIHAQAKKHGIEPVTFLPRKGDALIWSADLAHGGSDYTDSTRSRRSIVTHYCPYDRYPMYFHYGRHSEKIQWKEKSFFCYAEKILWPPP